ncbi:MAG: ABC transporter permease [Acidobacteriaceae bacterium]
MNLFTQIFQRKKMTDDLSEEMRQHLEEKIEAFMAAGMPREDAVHAGRRAFGNATLIEQRSREVWMWPWIESLWADVKFALRQLRKSPGFAITAILTLALGIGINTALFSIVDTVLLHPIALPQPDELVAVDASKPNFEDGSISYLNFRDWQRENHCFSALAVFRHTGFVLTRLGHAERIHGDYVSSDLFSLLGVKPVLGRLFTIREDEPGRGPVVLISEGLWARKFGLMPDVIGKTLALSGRDFTIIGVIPANFDLSFSTFRPGDVYVPIGQWQSAPLNDRSAGLSIHGVARLLPDATLAQAQADMTAVSEHLAAAYPEDDHGISASLTSLRRKIVGGVQPVLLALLGAVGFVLLIACINVANLLLARSNTRAHEFAVRLSLGASRTRIVRQLLTESTLLSLAGGALGLLLAAWGARAAVKLVPAALPRTSEIHLSLFALGTTFVISLTTGILFGLLPAWKLATQRPQIAMKENSRGISGVRHRTQDALVIFEISAALVLLVATGLMIRSLVVLSNSNPGFDPKGVLTFSLSVPYSPTAATGEVQTYFREVDRQIKRVHGVQAVSFSWGSMPMTGNDDEQLFWLNNEPKAADLNDMHWALRYIVEPDYLQVMHIPLLRGRFLTDEDRANTPPVAVVDESFARKYFGSSNPVGKLLNLDGVDKKVEIVGVVGHVMQWALDNDAGYSLRSQIYLSSAQSLGGQSISPSGIVSDIFARADNASRVFPEIQRTLHQMNPEQVAYSPETISQVIETTLAARLFFMILLGIFAGLALLLASIGLYGVISYLVGQRTQEMAIRMAVGANRGTVLLYVLRGGAKLALFGIGIGIFAALALTHLLTSISIAGSPMIYGVRSYDPLTLAVVSALLTVVTLAACYFPARRAASVDPMQALRAE